MKHILILSSIMACSLSATADWFRTERETNSQAFVRIAKAAAIGSGAGAVNGHFHNKVTFEPWMVHAGTWAAGHGANYKLNGDKQPTLTELWAYGIGQAIGEHVTTTTRTPLTATPNERIPGNVTLWYAAWKTFWFVVEKI